MSDFMTPVVPVPPKVVKGVKQKAKKAGTVNDATGQIMKPPPLRTNARIYPRRKTPPKFRPSRIPPSQRQDLDPETGIPTMSSQTRIQLQASDVLVQLESLPPGPFGPEHQLTIARNMALIQGATADILDERKTAEKRKKEIVSEARRGAKLRFGEEGGGNDEMDGEDSDANEGLMTPSSSEDDNVTPPPGNGNGRGNGGDKKRKHQDGEDNDKPKPSKRARLLFANPSLQIQSPLDISKYAPVPLRISYPPHPNTDRPDTWFIHNFSSLFRQLHTTISHYYSVHEIPLSDEPWDKCKMTPEFLKWAQQVAEPDPRLGSWDELLRDRKLRGWFVTAIVMRVFKVKVFGETWFGGTKEERDLMHQVDRAFLGREGFQRDLLRSTQARLLLGAQPVSSNFYASVAKLTAQLTILLTPLTSYLFSLPPPPGTPSPDITTLYQSLHNLVSHAGYLSIACKLTPSIIQIYDIRPGAIWEEDDMHALDMAFSFVESKELIIADYRQERHNLKHAVGKAESYMHSLAPPKRMRVLTDSKTDVQTLVADERAGKGTWRYRSARAAFDKLNAMYASKLALPPNRTHRALVKLSVWPVIRRYTPGTPAEAADLSKPLHEKDGFRIFLVSKGAVVAYYGQEHKRGVEEGYLGLGEWIGMKERQREDRDDWMGRVGRGVRNAVGVARVVAAVVATGLLGVGMDRVVGAGGVDFVAGVLEHQFEALKGGDWVAGVV